MSCDWDSCVTRVRFLVSRIFLFLVGLMSFIKFLPLHCTTRKKKTQNLKEAFLNILGVLSTHEARFTQSSSTFVILFLNFRENLRIRHTASTYVVAF